jgi:diguanylate cyclase (GGDEF)-like protein
MSAQAISRDESARTRDVRAASRDLAADARDQVAAREGTANHDAAADRARAASDRRQAAADRAQAADDRRQARVELERAQLDDLTGVYMRDLGRVTLQREIDRCRRSGEPFVLAFIDVDGLKQRNDGEGHIAGDALLRAVVGAVRSTLRSYDPIVRVGGDEFLCGFTNTELDASRRRVEEIRAAIEQGATAGSITVGLAALRPGDTLEDLTTRADLDMYSRKPAVAPS